ncbi:MAG: ComF family protein [Alphaproteobacteria bacterium]|nr:ComF family protein [Alphaproteobacteria bacterium]
MTTLQGAVRAAKQGTSLALDLLLPPQCLNCRGPVDRQGLLCAACWQGIAFIAPPYCACCGLPFAYDEGPDAVCGGCAARAPAFARARAAMVYDDASRALVLGFKHGDRLEAGAPFGRWLARAGAELLADAELIVPVPLHRWRLWRRRYNQAAVLAQALARASGLEVLPDLLIRRRATASQHGLSRSERRRNVSGAFAIKQGRSERLGGACVILVDDVLTTGATVEAAARTLLRAGARAVDVLTLARVVRMR